MGTEKSKPEGPQFQWEARLAEFPTVVDTRVGIFLEQLNTNDPFFFSYTNSTFSDRMVRYSIISVGNVTEVNVYSQ